MSTIPGEKWRRPPARHSDVQYLSRETRRDALLERIARAAERAAEAQRCAKVAGEDGPPQFTSAAATWTPTGSAPLRLNGRDADE